MSSVAYVTTTFPTLASFIETEVHLMRRRGVDVRVFTLRGVGTEYQPDHRDLVAITRAVGNPLSLKAWGSLLGWLARRPHVLVPEMIRILWASRRSGYALVGHIGYLPAAARLASLVESENIGRVHGAWSHFPGTVAYLAARLTRRPFSMSAHAGSDLYRTQAFLEQKARAAEFVTACVRGNAEMLRRLAGPEARIEWIYHGVDLSRFDGSGRRRDPEPLLLAVGRLARTKGYDVLIRALAILARRGVRPRLTLVGEGPERARLEALAAESGVAEQITMTGALTHRDLLPLYRRAWMLVSPSVVLASGYRDGIPNVIVEAMAMGVPCVGTRAAGLEEAIVPGETGALATSGDPESLAEAIESLLKRAEDLDAMGTRARARVLESFDVRTNFERTFALFWGADAAAADAREARVG